MSTTASTSHAWKFFSAGGVNQVAFRNGADLASLDQLDQKLWVALALPTRGIEFDTRTLDLIDTDKDGRIRPPELIAAVKWAEASFKDLGDLIKGGDAVPLSAIKDESIVLSARRILENLGKRDATSIALADVADTAKIFATTQFNGDGIVPADSAVDEATRRVIEDLIATVGGLPDRSGKPGVSQAKADQFFAEAQAFSDWHAKAEADAASLLPLGDATAGASAAIKAVKVKVDDYFARCRLAAFDSRAAGPLNRAEAEFVALAAQELTVGSADIARLPLAHVAPSRMLPLIEAVNPAWLGAMENLCASAVGPLLEYGKKTLSEGDWGALQSMLAPHNAWAAAKPATSVEPLGLARVRELLAGNARTAVAALLAQDIALEGEFKQIGSVEKLVLFQRDLVRLLNNSVSFAEFYGRRGSIFQAGSLFLDARTCHLCIEVVDAGKHAALAGFSGAYLAYCDVTRPGGAKKTIVAVFTDGDSDNLSVGRNGVFYDRKGLDWDATIAKIVANPISVREAFWSPYKKFVRLVEAQIAKRAAAAEAESQAKVGTAATAVAQADKSKPAPKEEPKKLDLGTIALIGTAISGISGMIGMFLGTLLGLGIWLPLGILGIVLLISGPSMLLAYMKLRQRNLAPILDANGWAINTKAKMNVPFGAALTHVAKLPANAERSLDDPFAEKPSPWKAYAVLLVLLVLGYCWSIGKLDSYLPDPVKHRNVIQP
ncbi:MAG: hypothetical protein HZA92_07935 [Verrucomicrobia bacterium]|nr:hypothetical protein [Verrucomicrobiota bacterium]